MSKIAIIRIRGTDDVKGEIESTMRMLRLHKKMTCSIYPKTDTLMGMLQRCKDYVTYGEIDEDTYKLLVEKRGIKKDGKLVNYFHLQPPRGGFERKGIKTPFTLKGALGYRKDKINVLIKKMI
ncbi:MAG: uL30 family ribosomal protein [Candidatus Woesearchaeota archaeon]